MVLWIKKDRGIVETINQVELFNGSDGTKGFFLFWSYKLFLSIYYSQAWAPLFSVQAAFRFLFTLGILISFPLFQLVCYEKTMSLWLKLMIVGHLAGLAWILHYMWWSFSFNLSFLTISMDAPYSEDSVIQRPMVLSHILSISLCFHLLSFNGLCD